MGTLGQSRLGWHFESSCWATLLDHYSAPPVQALAQFEPSFKQPKVRVTHGHTGFLIQLKVDHPPLGIILG